MTTTSARRRARGVPLALRLAAIGCSASLAAVLLPALGARADSSFIPTADAWVDAAHANRNHGTDPTLQLTSTPGKNDYLTFVASSLTGTVTSATLQVFVRAVPSGATLDVHTVADTSWAESAITYANAPAMGAVLHTSGPLAKNAYASIDVTAAVAGNGTFSFGLTTAATSTIKLSSREDGAHPPKLVVATRPPDTTPPTVPAGLTAAPAPTEIDLSWSPSTDDVGVAGYSVYRDGVALGSVDGTTTSFADTSPAPDTFYAYAVDAFDAAGNRSDQSDPAQAIIDTQPPTVPGNVTATAEDVDEVELSWSPSTDTVGVTGYTVYRGGTLLGSVGGDTTSFDDASAFPGTTYTYTVDASDLSGNRSSQSPPASASTDFQIAAAGDIACSPDDSRYNGGQGTASSCRQLHTSDQLMAMRLNAILTLGDEQYENGELANFQVAYESSWGRQRGITFPVPGNHEYQTPGAAGYYAYFGAAAGDPTKGYYSFDIGGWHMIALNSNCSAIGQCWAGSAEETWLKADLAAHPAQCTLAFFHYPRFSSGQQGNITGVGAFWKDLYAAHADLVLNGHDHDYERFAIQNPSEVADPNGIREFVVGTGGEEHHAMGITQPTSEVRNADAFGVLVLKLHATSYEWEFVSDGGTFTDSGSDSCR